jgi:hypothetical protein
MASNPPIRLSFDGQGRLQFWIRKEIIDGGSTAVFDYMEYALDNPGDIDGLPIHLSGQESQGTGKHLNVKFQGAMQMDLDNVPIKLGFQEEDEANGIPERLMIRIHHNVPVPTADGDYYRYDAFSAELPVIFMGIDDDQICRTLKMKLTARVE